jgi:hypothetical protein
LKILFDKNAIIDYYFSLSARQKSLILANASLTVSILSQINIFKLSIFVKDSNVIRVKLGRHGIAMIRAKLGCHPGKAWMMWAPPTRHPSSARMITRSTLQY